MKLAEKLVLQRKQKGLSQVQLAETIHVTRQAVSRWEVGDAVPSMDNLKRISELYALPMEYFLNDDTEEPGKYVAPTEKSINKSQSKRLNLSWKWFVLVISVLFIFMAVGFHVVHSEEQIVGEVSLNRMEREEVEPSLGEDFNLKW